MGKELQEALNSLKSAEHWIKASQEAAPIPMILHCPNCQVQHIDTASETWSNPPHRSHLCHNCGFIWRPCDTATVGVEYIKTKGDKDMVWFVKPFYLDHPV